MSAWPPPDLGRPGGPDRIARLALGGRRSICDAPMRVIRAALIRPQDAEAFAQGRDVEALTIVNKASVSDPHDMVASWAWEVALDPDDHPHLGVLEVLVKPDGTFTALGFVAGATSASFGIQALELDTPGEYRLELRPMTQATPPPGPRDAGEAAAAWSSATHSDRRTLAAVPFEVIDA